MKMKIFLDTNVIVASCLEAHERHEPAFELLERVLDGRDSGVTSAHALAEAYAVMTRLPNPFRLTAHETAALLEENYMKPFQIVSLTGKEYGEVIIRMSQCGFVGGLIYDAIHLECAIKASVDCVFYGMPDIFKNSFQNNSNRVS